MMEMMEEIAARIAHEGNAVVVGRGAPYFLRENPTPSMFFSTLRAPKKSAAC